MALDLNTLEKTLQKQQWVGGQAPSDADKATFDALKTSTISAETHPHAFGWFVLVWKFSDAIRDSWKAGGGGGDKGGKKGKEGGKKGGKKDAKKEKPADDLEMDDLFGDDDAPAEKVVVKKKEKKKAVAMSLVMLEVKPVEKETPLDDLAAKIFATITQDGLFWKTEYKKEPIAFGIEKLIVGFSCEDEKVSVDDIVEKIEEINDMVQSVEIQAFNKI